VIRLGLRLTLRGGKEAAVRLVLIAVAVAIGVGLLLTTLATLNAVTHQNSRYAWLETAYDGSNAPSLQARSSTSGVDPLWWNLRADYFHNKQIGRVDLAATGPTSPVPPGIAKLPGPGEFYASPALTKLLDETPAAQLGDRFPGKQIGVIGRSALPAPNSLVIVIGHTADELSHQDGPSEVVAISTTPPNGCTGECAFGVGIDDNGMSLILAVVVAALLFPVLIFVGGATRLSAARREQRFAAMRLVGATPRQIAVISAVESGVATLVGVALGFGLFFAFRPTLASIPFTGNPFFSSDMSLSRTNVLVVAIGIPIGAVIAARIALRRVNISPLGVSRRVTPRSPRAWRLLPLLAGALWLYYLAYDSDIGNSRKYHGSTQAYAYLIGILLALTGLVTAGPWLTMVCARFIARRARRPAGLVAARRLADNPTAGFRAISGLVIAVFIGSCSIGAIKTIVAYNGAAGHSRVYAATLIERSYADPDTALVGLPASTTSKLAAIRGVTGVTSIRTDTMPPSPTAPQMFYVSCAQLPGTPALGHCAPGAVTASIQPEFGGAIIDHHEMPAITWPAAALSAAQLEAMPIDSIVVGTDGSVAAVEQARSVLDLSGAKAFPPQTETEYEADSNRLLNSYRRLADVVILTSLAIAGCSLAVGVAGGLAERKRPFSLLRLAGTPLGVLRRIVTLEAAAPLLVGATVSAAAGLFAARLILRAQLKETLRAPDGAYYAIIVVGLALSMAVIVSVLPLLRRITGPETARND
jgi:hypothetical protein